MNKDRVREAIDAIHRRNRRQDRLTLAGFIFGGLIVVGLIVFSAAGKYIAGQGDGLTSATKWMKERRPNGTVECQSVDSDDNGYISCTVTWTDKAGETQYDSLECGVNRWYQGFHVTGCRPVWRR